MSFSRTIVGTKLFDACCHNRVEIVKNILERYPFIDANCQDWVDDTLLALACYYGSTDVVRFLLSRDEIDVNKQSPDGRNTALHELCTGEPSDTEILRLLLSSKNINVNIQNRELDTPLHTACYNIFPNHVKLLLSCDHGIDVSLQNNLKEIPLHLAVNYLRLDAIEQILKMNPKLINERDIWGRTPLMIACNIRNLAKIRFLLLNEADPTITSNEKLTPLDAACESGDESIIKEVLKYTLVLDPEFIPSLSPWIQPKVSRMQMALLISTAINIKRIGKLSFIRLLPIEIIRLLFCVFK